MSEAVVYLETDDEVTSVVRRMREADAERVVLVVPGRSRATSSAVALRLLARAAVETGREVTVVGDALTRSLAAEAGLAAFATLQDARRAEPPAESPTEVRHATIHVVRGTDETAARPSVAADDVTRPVVAVRQPATGERRGPRMAVVAAVLGLVLIAGVAGGAMLPGATVTIDPATEAVGPIRYVIEIADPERLSGTAEASATVTATGDYQDRAPATGTVVLFNWSSFDQAIAARTLVAAGDQAYETQSDVVVPRGSLTAQGTIQAGEASVEVRAAAPGPAGNVGADEIDTVLSRNADARLQGGFPENNERRVTNPEPTTGGIDEEGVEFTRADVDRAVDALTADLRARAADALPEAEDALVVEADGEPEIEGLEDLVGRRDRPEASIRGSLQWEAWTADRDDVFDASRARIAEDPSVVPASHALLPESVEVGIEEANVEAGIMRVSVTTSGRSAAQIDREEVAERIAGLDADEAEAALEHLGQATVELWPDWVASVPSMAWRIEVRVVDP